MIKETQTFFALILVGVLVYLVYKQKDALKEKMGMGNQLLGSFMK